MRGLVYVGSALHNSKRASTIMRRFEAAGAIITYDWTVHGQVYTEEELEIIGISEMDGVKRCDVFFMVFPGNNGCHVELGLAFGFRKHIVLLEEAEVERKPFYHLPGNQRFKDEESAFQHTLKFLDNLESKDVE